jgi:hypothetical protein
MIFKNTFISEASKKHFWKKCGKKTLLEKVWQKNTFRKSVAKKILLKKVWQKLKKIFGPYFICAYFICAYFICAYFICIYFICA